jgi:hypothetical protein
VVRARRLFDFGDQAAREKNGSGRKSEQPGSCAERALSLRKKFGYAELLGRTLQIAKIPQ